MQAEKEPCPQPKKLYRSPDQRVIAGVAGGIGEYLSVDPNLIRIIFVLLGLLGGIGILVYLIFWILLPVKEKASQPESKTIKENVKDISQKTQKASQQTALPGVNYTKVLISLIIILFGIIIIIYAAAAGFTTFFGLNSFGLFVLFLFLALLVFLIS